MRIVPGSMVRTKTNLNLRKGAGVQQPRLATLQTGVLALVLAAPTAGWVKVKINGHAHKDDLSTIYSEPDKSSSVEAKRGSSDWQDVEIEGYLSTGYLMVEDGSA